MKLKLYKCSTDGCTNTMRMWSKKKIDPSKVKCRKSCGEEYTKELRDNDMRAVLGIPGKIMADQRDWRCRSSTKK